VVLALQLFFHVKPVETNVQAVLLLGAMAKEDKLA
jgi:hypothetical protein